MCAVMRSSTRGESTGCIPRIDSSTSAATETLPVVVLRPPGALSWSLPNSASASCAGEFMLNGIPTSPYTSASMCAGRGVSSRVFDGRLRHRDLLLAAPDQFADLGHLDAQARLGDRLQAEPRAGVAQK